MTNIYEYQQCPFCWRLGVPRTNNSYKGCYKCRCTFHYCLIGKVWRLFFCAPSRAYRKDTVESETQKISYAEVTVPAKKCKWCEFGKLLGK